MRSCMGSPELGTGNMKCAVVTTEAGIGPKAWLGIVPEAWPRVMPVKVLSER